jgi:hypothetical protein
MTNLEIANQLKALGLREFGVSVWAKVGDTPKFAGVTADVKSNQFGASLNIPAGDGGFVPVRLAKNVPTNKASYDIFLYTATADWTPDPAKMPNAKPIKKGDMTAFAH